MAQPFIEDPIKSVQARIEQINRSKPEPLTDDMDVKELAEREEAADAYAKERPQHFVDYCEDCIKTSVHAMTEIRRMQAECWRVFNEEAPPNYANKESWQSKTIVPKPFGAVQFAMAVVRKAFDVQFLSIENEQNAEAAEFWKKLLGLMLSQNFADFPIQFTDACGMSFAVGQSLEMLPVWRPGRGLRFILVEPWKIHRDPDAISRQPQSGLYWIHQEWMDYYLLRKFQDAGRYENIDETFRTGGTESDNKHDTNLTKEELARRRNMFWKRSGFRTMILTSEFWGTVLGPTGELLLPSANYTVAGGKVIRAPKASPYKNLRWPGMSFSVLPNFLRFDGRGIVQGIKSLWYSMCSLLCLHMDNLNWVVNPPTEIDVSSLVDPTDVNNVPGKPWLTKGTPNGQQVVRTIDRRSSTSDILANMNFADQRFQEGTFVTNLVQGLPGYRAEVTARESAQSLEQALTIFSLIGKNIEHGALNVIRAAAETVAANISHEELTLWMGEEVASRYVDGASPTGVTLPQLTTGSFQVSGISALMRDMEIVNSIRNVILPLFEGQAASVFMPYLKPYQLLRSIEKRLNLRDEGILIDENMAGQLDQNQQRNQNAAIDLEHITNEAAALQSAQGVVAGQGVEGEAGAGAQPQPVEEPTHEVAPMKESYLE